MSGRLSESLTQLPTNDDRLRSRDMPEIQNEFLLDEVIKLGLPNLTETVRTELELLSGERSPLRPLHVRPPLPGRYTTRSGERLSRHELIEAVDEWLVQTDGQTRFIVQGGNRYVNTYASKVLDDVIPDIKVMSVEKAPLSAQLLTILTAEERQSLVAEEMSEVVGPLLSAESAATAISMTRAELLQTVAGFSLQGPFSPVTSDESLQSELSTAIKLIEEGVTIPNQAAISALMSGTSVAEALCRNEPVYFLDDLFYRGRTLYSLAILMTACGGDPMNIKLTTLSSDIKSVSLESPFHNVLRGSVLYPFENSIRTEQGYWQDVGTHYMFTDMGAYWEHLHAVVDSKASAKSYDDWQAMMKEWSAQHLTMSRDELDMSLVGPLLWLSVYHSNFGLELDIDTIVDQKGYKIGACVPFAQLIDRFISQEEPVEARRQFKDQVRDILSAVESVATDNPEGYQTLVRTYGGSQRALDYQGLGFIAEPDLYPTAFDEGGSNA